MTKKQSKVIDQLERERQRQINDLYRSREEQLLKQITEDYQTTIAPPRPKIPQKKTQRLDNDWVLRGTNELIHVDCLQPASAIGCETCNKVIPEEVQRMALAQNMTDKVKA